MSFVWSVNRIGRIVFGAVLKFWLVLFIQKRDLIVEILFFLPTAGPRGKKTEEEARRSGVLFLLKRV